MIAIDTVRTTVPRKANNGGITILEGASAVAEHRRDHTRYAIATLELPVGCGKGCMSSPCQRNCTAKKRHQTTAHTQHVRLAVADRPVSTAPAGADSHSEGHKDLLSLSHHSVAGLYH